MISRRESWENHGIYTYLNSDISITVRLLGLYELQPKFSVMETSTINLSYQDIYMCSRYNKRFMV